MKITLKQKKDLINLLTQANGRKTKAISKIQKMRPSLSFAEAKAVLVKIIGNIPDAKHC